METGNETAEVAARILILCLYLLLLAPGYISEDESEGGESDVVLVEDYSALEEEGITGLAKGKYTLREVHMGFKHGGPYSIVVILGHHQCSV